MEKELITELNEIRKELEIPMEDFIKIIALAKMHCNRSKIKISDEMLYEIIIGALTNYDYEDMDDKETLEQEMRVSHDAAELLLVDSMEETSFSSQELKEIWDEYIELGMLLKERTIPISLKRKKLEEMVDRSTKSLGL